MIILALDLASTSGWAVGQPGGHPAHGSICFAKPGASHEAIFANAWQWINYKLIACNADMIVWEAPMQTSFSRGRTNSNTTTILHGLPAVIGAAAYMRGIYDIRKADTKDVRNHFIGHNPKRARAKWQVMLKCSAMGWQVTDDNEADALAVWHYMCSLINPVLAMRATPLFSVSS